MNATLVLAVLVLFGSTTSGPDDDETVVPLDQGLGIGLGDVDPSTGQPIGVPPGPVTDIVNIGTDLVEQFCVGINWTDGCVPADPEQTVISAAMVATAFRYVPLPESTLIVQPPGGHTLVNFETNFYTTAPDILPRPTAVRILGQVVQLRVEPATFTWDFGDGTRRTTTERGAPYPDLELTHSYQRKGRVGVRLHTTYRAWWRMTDTAPWQAVEGTVTITGTPQSLRVLTAQPTLVGGDAN